ncbi:hypothetical protein LptCag_1132 [Leptospirillum ferriphilum]|uniref:Uncharacterized protein n=1 Tax=Leptospirillum ferriphilum TaxID=178606 RepID=A0A094X746_9BACT|nr:hypothetical protein LptCag_1132 [Leptospirillum ferriphilum]
MLAVFPLPVFSPGPSFHLDLRFRGKIPFAGMPDNTSRKKR